MIKRDDVVLYHGREHAKAKHALLESYVQRYMMIIGRSVPELVFVDCFAGPWKSATDDLSDTSFGLSLKAIHRCAHALKAKFGKMPTIRALWIEANDDAFASLSKFASENASSTVAIEVIHGRFEEQLDRIAAFIGPKAYAFIFIDPKGYSRLIDPSVLAPLLKLGKAELLINYMWDHIRFALAHKDAPGHMENMRRLFGKNTERLVAITDAATRESECLAAYEQELRNQCSTAGKSRLRTLGYAIRDAKGQRLVRYFLVHTTHAAKGLSVFAEECVASDRTQSQIYQWTQQVRRDEQAATVDMFGTVLDEPIDQVIAVTEPWLRRIPVAGAELTVDVEEWASMLEEGRCLPSALQQGLRELIKTGILENPHARRPRPKKVVDYDKGETIRRLQ